MANEIKEEEVLNVDLSDGGENSPEGEDDEVVPPQEETPKPQESEQELQGELEPAPEPTIQSEPKPVEEETPREKALRLEVQRLREDRRKADNANLFPEQKQQKNEEIENRVAKLKEVYSEDELKNMEEAIDVLATKKGYVRQDQAYQQSVNDTVESFLDAHPEYKPENDADDARWNRFKTILQRDYNMQGKTPKQVSSLFDKVNRDVAEELGEAQPVVKDRANERNVQVQRQKIQSVSHAGGGTRSTEPSAPQIKVDPSVRSHFKGFEDEDFST